MPEVWRQIKEPNRMYVLTMGGFNITDGAFLTQLSFGRALGELHLR